MKGVLATNLEYAALRVAIAPINVLPYPAALALAHGLAWFAVRVLGFKRARTYARIRSVFPEKSPREVRRIAVKSLANILQCGVEMMRAVRLDRAWMDRYVVEGPKYRDRLQALLDEGRGVVVMVPHTGNWFMAGWCLSRYGLSITGLGSHQRNPKIDAWMRRQYGDFEVLDRDRRDTLAVIRDRLREKRVFAIMPDLRVRKPDVEADFLGGKANVSRAGAMFAVNAGAPIVVAMMTRANGRHVFDHIATLRPDPKANPREEARRLTRETMRLLDAGVQQHPEDWFWFNKRWILEPPEMPPSSQSAKS